MSSNFCNHHHKRSDNNRGYDGFQNDNRQNRDNGYQGYDKCSKEKQEHVHEVLGSVMIAEPLTEPHNHRFATVTGEAIEIDCGKDHFHEIRFRTDFYEDHFHEFCGKTSGAIPVGDRHVHFLESCTSVNDGHNHKFRVGTLIDNPIGEDC